MSYLETIKQLNENIKSNNEIPAEEKAKAKELLGKLANLLVLY